MKYIKIFAIGSALSWSLSSCVSENLSGEKSAEGTGTTSINVDMLRPSPTRTTIETADFPVKIVCQKDNKVFASYEKASKVPNKIQMPVGDYYAEANTPGELLDIMYSPYYLGRDSFTIVKDIATYSTVTCRMANGSFTVKLSAEFTEAFQTWTISIDDGTDRVIKFENGDGEEENGEVTYGPVYLLFKEKTEKITVNFAGDTKSGNHIVTSNTLTKEQASQRYDDDTSDFSGGDEIEVEFSPVESTEGDITNITLKAEISFEETEEKFEMEVTDKEGAGGSEDNPGGNTPGGDTSAITLDLPNNMTVDGSTDPKLGDTYIKAEAGIKSIKVSIDSSSDEMISSLEDLNTNYGVNFLNGAEIVENNDVVALFKSLNQTLSVPSKGDKEYTFPIGNFFKLLKVLSGKHTFNLTVTDLDNNTKSGVLILTVE